MRRPGGEDKIWYARQESANILFATLRIGASLSEPGERIALK